MTTEFDQTASSPLAELTIGAVAGLRSAMPVAALAWRSYFAHRGAGESGAPAGMAHPLTLATTTMAALGELTADKLPVVGSRIRLAPLAGRAFSGAWAAASLARGSRGSTARGALLGAVGAIAASFGGYYLRRALTRRVAPDLVVALAEDGLAIGLAVLAIKTQQAAERA